MHHNRYARTSYTVSYTHLDVYKRQGDFWDRVIRMDFAKDDFHCIAPLTVIDKKLGYQDSQRMNHALLKGLDSVLGDGLRHCSRSIETVSYTHLPPDKSLVDLASKIYDETELLELMKFNGSLNELNIKYPIECLQEDNGMYRVSYLGDESVVIFLFDGSGNRLFGSTHSTRLLKSDFDKLVKGQSLDDVRADVYKRQA